MKKIIYLIVFSLIFLDIFSGYVASAETTSGGSNIIEVPVEGKNYSQPDFAVIGSDTDKLVEVKPAAQKERSAWGVIYIILIPVGVVLTAGVAFIVFYLDRGRAQNRAAANFKLLYRIFSIACVFILVFGTGLFGTLGLMEDRYKPNYFFAGAEPSQTGKVDNTAGFTDPVTNRKIFSTFEFGLEGRYDRVYYSMPHFWNRNDLKYNYAKPDLPASKSYLYELGATSFSDDDNCNYWYVLPATSESYRGENFYCEAEYRLSMPAQFNFKDTRLYDRLRMVFKAVNTGGGNVNLTVLADTRRKEAQGIGDLEPVIYNLGTYNGKSNEKVEITFNLGLIAPEDRPYLSRIIFRTSNKDIKLDASGNSYQKNELYYLEMYSTQKATLSATLIGDTVANQGIKLSFDSEYLGSLGYSLYGAYSASGFYDTTDKKWKLWFGSGIPENIASDNIYYIESVDPNLGWSTPKRLILNDPKEVLTPAGKAPGYGGDPCVIKINGIYYMYFSGLEDSPAPPNKIYLATSKNGIDFTVYGCVVDVPKLGLGYGAGSPSVIYKDNKFYLYYYTQSPSYEYPDEPTGFVLKIGDNPYEFGKAIATTNTLGAADVKWMPSLNLWVCTDYTEGLRNGYEYDRIRIGFSKDGINWDFGNAPLERPAQDYSSSINHNPGFIGTETGYGFENMFLTYGVNDLPLRGMDAGLQMDTRKLEWSRVTFKLGE